MKIYLNMFLNFLLIIHSIPAIAENIFSIDKKINCGEFSAKANSMQYVTDFGTILKTQKIRVVSKSVNTSTYIDLNQHYSPNKHLNGLHALDDEASDWFCLKAATGRHYLWIGFTCANEDSTSCRYNTERGELYDNTGRSMHLDRLTDAQADALYRQLRIPSALPDGGFITPAHSILF